MKILITGGSGFLGINLTRYLFKQKTIDVVILDIMDFDYPEINQIVFVKGDIRNKSIVAQVMEDVDIVIHTAAVHPLYTKKRYFFY